jgi:DNA-binding GntR family transcriptional regulator
MDGFPLADDVILCVCELATNAVRHSRSSRTGGRFVVRAEVHGGEYVWAEVEDQGGTWPGTDGAAGCAENEDEQRGHGLDIVAALASAWGIDGSRTGRVVWFRIDWPGWGRGWWWSRLADEVASGNRRGYASRQVELLGGVMAALEFAPPKYAQIVNAIMERIGDGTYPAGTALPSETQLIREFGVSRPTVVRALQVLPGRGWIDREHGRGSFVRSRSAVDEQSRPGLALLDRPDGTGSELLQVGAVAVPNHVLTLLGLPAGGSALLRKELRRQDGELTELVSSWFPVELAEGTELAEDRALAVPVHRHLHATKRVRFDHVAERISARLASAEESRLLGMARRAAVLVVIVTVYDADDRPLMVSDIVMPGDLHELFDAYPFPV